MSDKKPVVNSNQCIGSELCVEICPKVFEMKGGKSSVHNPSGDSEENIQEAIDACPAGAIEWA